jgi:L-lactate dehydrogenase
MSAVLSSKDYAVLRGAHVVVITAGARQNPGESRLSLLERNLRIFKSIVPQIVEHAPHCTIVVVSNPVDAMAWMTWKLSGFPVGRVIGSGTSLDSSRFRTLVAERLGVSTRSVHGYIVGEHGDSSVPVWSGLNVGGVTLQSINPKIGQDDDPEEWHSVTKGVVKSAYEIIELKGYTNWAIGLTVCDLVNNILRNSHSIAPVSTLVKGLYGIDQEVFLSIPCVLGAAGVKSALKISLNETEQAKLRASAATIAEAQSKLTF